MPNDMGRNQYSHRNLSSTEHLLEAGNVAPEEGHQKSEQNGREEIQVLCLFVEQRRMLEDG